METGERKIHPRKWKEPNEKAAKESGERISNEREKCKEGEKRIFLRILFSPVGSLSLFFFHPVEVVNGFLLDDLPRCVNASAG